jgi:hypothetical protein
MQSISDKPQLRPARATFLLSVCMIIMAMAQTGWAAEGTTVEHRAATRERSTHFVSTSMFMLFNLLPDPPIFFQLNYGFRPTDQDTILVEAITWTYDAPLGIPLFGGDYGEAIHKFPGYVQAFGVGLAYQRYLWRGLFGTLHATPFWQIFRGEDGSKLQSGFQLFMVARLGYHFELWNNRLFIEPSVAATAWPINTNLPASFEAKEAQWPSYFAVEPGLNVGFNF